MVKLELTDIQAQLLVQVIDNAQFNGVIGQAQEVFSDIEKLLDVRNKLVAPPEEAQEEE